jgi:hypothetical protein
MKLDAKTKKEIEELIEDEFNNVSNLDVKDDGEIYFTLPVRRSGSRFGYDVDEVYDIESENKAIKIEMQDVHIEQDDPDDPYKRLVCVTAKVSIDDELMGESYSMRHIMLFEKFTTNAKKGAGAAFEFLAGPGDWKPFERVRRKIKNMAKQGWEVQETEQRGDQYSGPGVYWEIGDPNGTNFTGIGFRIAKEPNKPNYFYHNSHSGNIFKPNTALNAVWNHHSERPGPGGWYTFDEKYVHDVLNRMILSGLKPKEEAKPKEASAPKTLELNTTVDDYEHEGDTENQVNTLKNLGFRVLRVTPAGEVEPDDEPRIKFSITFGNEGDVKAMLDKCKYQIEKMHRTHDGSECEHPSQLKWYLSEFDKKFNTKYLEKFKGEIEDLEKLYNQ